MDDIWPRLLIIAVVASGVVAAALGTRRWQRPGHPPLDVAGRRLGPGAVMFTATDCTTCRDALDVVRPLDVPFREVTWELEGKLLEELGVATVPLTLFVGPGDRVIAQIVGVPTRRRLARSVSAWRKAMDR